MRRPGLARRAIPLSAGLLLLAAASGSSRAAQPTVTPETNLLSYSSGTIVRSYTPGVNDVQELADGGASRQDGAKGPIQVVYELAGVATLSRMTVTLDATGVQQPPWTTTVAVSTTSAKDGFRDLGMVRSAERAGPQTVPGVAGVQARWIRVTATLPDTNPPIRQIFASGTLAPRPPTAPPFTGDFWSFDNRLNDAGGVRITPAGDSPERVEVTQIADGVNGLRCSEDGFLAAFPGRLSGRTWTYVSTYHTNDVHGRLIVNDEGTLLVGADEAGMRAFARAGAGRLPSFCAVQQLGKGAKGALVLNGPRWNAIYPIDDKDSLAEFSAWHFGLAAAALLTPALLKDVDVVVLNGVCNPNATLTSQQSTALMQWVAAGRKLLIEDADECGGGLLYATHYDFLPYPFFSDNPGARGAKGTELRVVESDTLGTTDPGDAKRFIDTAEYVKANNDLGDANTVVSQDAHWCGHLFGTNADSVSGFMQMYAVYGQGLIIFDGLDHDDGSIPQYRTLRRLEYDQPVPATLPCTRHVNAGFVIDPDQTLTFVPGKVQTLTASLHVIRNQDWTGHVFLSSTGAFRSTVAPGAIDLPPGDVAISVVIEVPASTVAGNYAVVVKGSSASGQTAEATLSLHAVATADTLRNALDKGCKVAVYGVNFDFNRASLRPDAEPVLQQILALFVEDPALVAEVGGHTDNVGTAAYNLTLSGGRADAVKTWLVAHGVAASRLTTRGYGDKVPLVPNDSDANRAKNRRVELKKPNCGDPVPTEWSGVRSRAARRSLRLSPIQALKTERASLTWTGTACR